VSDGKTNFAVVGERETVSDREKDQVQQCCLLNSCNGLHSNTLRYKALVLGAQLL